MKNKEYWQKRAEAVAGEQFKKAGEYVTSLIKEYEKAKLSIQRDIEIFYQRFAMENKVDLAEAKKLLGGKELAEFKMTLEEFTEKAKNNIDGIWEQQLNNVSYKVRVSRLEALQIQIQHQMEMLMDSQQKSMNKLLSDIYEDTYYRNIYELQKGLGVGVEFAKLDTQTIEKAIHQKWMEGDFSSRIWDNKSKLLTELQTNLVQSFIRGDSIDITSRILAKRMDVSRSRAATLVNTESANIASRATMTSYKNSGVVKQYENLATLDLKTSDICRAMDGKVFNVAEMQPGLNAPPFHANCRTTTLAYFPDVEDEERIARDIDGKVYKVDGNISYKNWYDQHVVGKYGKEEAAILEKKIKNAAKDKEQYVRYKAILGKDAPRSFDKFQELKYNNTEDWNRLKSDYRKHNAYNKIIANEPAITQDLKEISDFTGVDMVGLEFRVKSKESYLRKINSDSDGSLDPRVIDETILSTNDVIRYTYQDTVDNLVDAYNKVTEKLLERNYSEIKVKNFWVNRNSAYKGVNCTFRSPEGQNFEVQFHTPESFALKNGELHRLYEEARQDGVTPERYAELTYKMIELSSKLTEPQNIREIKSRR